MRYIKARTLTRELTDGRKIHYPEGLENAQAIRAIPASADLDFWIVDDDQEIAPNERARPTDLPIADVPGSPLDGMRLVPVVMSGMPDCTIGADGRLVPIDAKTGEPVDPAVLEVVR